MTEQELKDIRERINSWYQEEEIDFKQAAQYEYLLDTIEGQEKKIERLSKSLEEIDKYEIMGPNWIESLSYMKSTARKALEETK